MDVATNDINSTWLPNSSQCPCMPSNNLVLYIDGLATNVVVLLGLVGNGLTIAVMAQRAMRCTTNYYLSALAAWDSVVLVCTALLIGLPGIPGMDAYCCNFYAYVVKFVYPLALTAHTATVWLTVSFTVERYIAVCHPMKAPSLCTISNARKTIATISVVSVLYNATRWAEYDVVTSASGTILLPQQTAFGTDSVYLLVYLTWLYIPFMCVVPIILLFIFNTFLITSVHRSRKERRAMNVKQQRENSVTITLVLVIIVFIICQVNYARSITLILSCPSHLIARMHTCSAQCSA